MKNLVLIAIIALFTVSCDFNDQPENINRAQEWRLSAYEVLKSNDQSELVSVSDSTYNYTLEYDGKFVKTVGKHKLEGTYETSIIDGIEHFDFSYNVKNSLLIHSCLPDVEQFYINKQGQMVGTWEACDGVRFYFDKR